jgi:Fe-S cluster assembly ATP-binding protein
MAFVDMQHLTFETNGHPILQDLSLSIAEREIHALLGANGSGKSTLAYLLMGCEGYTTHGGTITFKGIDLAPLPMFARARLGMTMAWQEPARFEGLTVSQYITVAGPGIDPDSYLTQVGLAPEVYRHRLMDSSLSGGERKRIELASVLAMHPQFAILDEPTAGIDMLSMEDITRVIRLLRDNGASVLLITHQEPVALAADHASQLCGGRIIASGRPREIAEQYKKGRCVQCDGATCLPISPIGAGVHA